MPNNKVAKRYAKSLYLFARQKKVVEDVLTDVKELLQIMKEVPAFEQVMSNPVFTINRKKSILRNIVKNTNDVFQKFVEMIVEKGRSAHIKQICTSYEEIYRNQKGIISGEIQSVVPLDKTIISKVEKQLSDQIKGKEIQLENVLNPEILGGFLVKFQDKLLDQSVRKQLTLIKQTIIK